MLLLHLANVTSTVVNTAAICDWICRIVESQIFSLLFLSGGLVVSILANGTRDRGFKPGRSRWIFRASEKSSVCLPSEGQ
jgi:hypothetical protein